MTRHSRFTRLPQSRAISRGFAKGMGLTGMFYEHGLHVEQNHPEAAKWYRKAIETGEPEAVERAKQLLEDITL